MVKLNSKEWAEQVEKGLRKHELLKSRQRKKRFQDLRRYIPVTLLIGIVTAFLYIALFGWEWMLKGLFNAVMGATLVATALALLAEKVR